MKPVGRLFEYVRTNRRGLATAVAFVLFAVSVMAFQSMSGDHDMAMRDLADRYNNINVAEGTGGDEVPDVQTGQDAAVVKVVVGMEKDQEMLDIQPLIDDLAAKQNTRVQLARKMDADMANASSYLEESLGLFEEMLDCFTDTDGASIWYTWDTLQVNAEWIGYSARDVYGGLCGVWLCRTDEDMLLASAVSMYDSSSGKFGTVSINVTEPGGNLRPSDIYSLDPTDGTYLFPPTDLRNELYNDDRTAEEHLQAAIDILEENGYTYDTAKELMEAARREREQEAAQGSAGEGQSGTNVGEVDGDGEGQE